MAGYQGWFNAEGDGAGRGWNHYKQNGRFEPGYCKIDFWPEMSEYAVKYKTAFSFEDGSSAYVFSSYDGSTVDLHFKWMQEYGIDGVFIQRFVTTIKNSAGYNHSQKVLESAIKAAEKYGRIISIMYDLSGMNPEDYQKVIDDWKQLVVKYDLLGDSKPATYLSHRGKPLVAVWGAGFNDGRKYSFGDVEKIVDFLKNDPEYGGCSVMLGIPTYWRDLNRDTQSDPALHELLEKIDIVHPWFVGRYNEETYPAFKPRIKEDIAWCNKAGVDYVPTVFPGFSWHNMYPDFPSDQIPRNKGSFYWSQLSGALEMGAEMIYVAMFDEVDEGTAIFKCANKVPVVTTEQVAEGGIQNKFVPVDAGVESDYFMFLTGQAGKILRKEIHLSDQLPLKK